MHEASATVFYMESVNTKHSDLVLTMKMLAFSDQYTFFHMFAMSFTVCCFYQTVKRTYCSFQQHLSLGYFQIKVRFVVCTTMAPLVAFMVKALPATVPFFVHVSLYFLLTITALRWSICHKKYNKTQ